MNPELQKELLTRLDALAAKLGIAAQAVWGFYLKQAQIEAATQLVTALLCLVMMILCALVAARAWKEVIKDSDAAGWGVAGILSGLSAGCLLIPLIVALQSALTAILNPEFWAFQELLKSLH